MAGDGTGVLFRVTTFGESHGPALGAVVEGCPPGLALDIDALQADLDRRRPGQSKLTTPRKEADRVEVLSGLFEGRTTGTAIALLLRNEGAYSKSYDHVRDLYRPGHADFTYAARYGVRDHRGGGRASARETAARVAAAAIARQWLAAAHGVEVLGWVASVADVEAVVDAGAVTREAVEAHATRCPDPTAAAAMEAAIKAARADGDTLGGVVGCLARGVPAGWGAPVFDRLEADLAKACLSLPACKGFEIGSGFAGTRLRGTEHNDAFVMEGDRVRTATNRAGGVLGGISTGEDILVRAAFKPVSSHFAPQQTVTTDGRATTFRNKGRHDPCVLPRAVPLVEAAMLLTLADHALRAAAVRG
ncbi:MAG: chorismate synthase [Myxococcales bacterium]|nr:chorismate synthase [Myxococcales bacterium]